MMKVYPRPTGKIQGDNRPFGGPRRNDSFDQGPYPTGGVPLNDDGYADLGKIGGASKSDPAKPA